MGSLVPRLEPRALATPRQLDLALDHARLRGIPRPSAGPAHSLNTSDDDAGRQGDVSMMGVLAEFEGAVIRERPAERTGNES